MLNLIVYLKDVLNTSYLIESETTDVRFFKILIENSGMGRGLSWHVSDITTFKPYFLETKLYSILLSHSQQYFWIFKILI